MPCSRTFRPSSNWNGADAPAGIPSEQFSSPCQPSLDEQYRHQRNRNVRSAFRNGNERENASPCGDGVIISVDGQSRSDYDRMIKNNFQYTQDNYAEALNEAAKKGLPVVAIFGGWENNNSRRLIEESLPQAKLGAARDAVYIYIERSKCGDPELAKFANSQLAGGHGAPITIVLSVRPDANGKPTPNEYNFRWQGAHPSCIAPFTQSIIQARAVMDSYRGQFNVIDAQTPLSTEAPRPEPPTVEQTAVGRPSVELPGPRNEGPPLNLSSGRRFEPDDLGPPQNPVLDTSPPRNVRPWRLWEPTEVNAPSPAVQPNGPFSPDAPVPAPYAPPLDDRPPEPPVPGLPAPREVVPGSPVPALPAPREVVPATPVPAELPRREPDTPAPKLVPPPDAPAPLFPARREAGPDTPAPVLSPRTLYDPEGPATPLRPGAPSPPGTSSAPMSMDTAYAALNENFARLQAAWSKETQSQGIIGRTFDAAKNNIGASAEGKNWYDPRRGWSNLFDSDLGSQAVKERLNANGQQLAELKRAVDSHDEVAFRAGYKALTGIEFDGSQPKVAPLKGAEVIKAYDKSQRTGVDTTTDIAAGLASVASLRFKGAGLASTMRRSTMAGVLIGGTTKSGLMQIDGTYANLPRDFGVGSLMGGIVPLSELAGSQASRFGGKRMGLTVSEGLLTARIETQGVGLRTRFLSAALKSGTAGTVFGAIESPGREIITDLQEGKEIKPLHLLESSVKGASVGFVGGTVLGGISDRIGDSFRAAFPGKVVGPRTTIDGVEIPPSGAVTLEDASKILKVKPDELLAKAAHDPYGAVQDAVKLHEKTGLNIKKVDPQTGKSILPDAFSNALTTVQNVELLTAESGVKLAKKVEVVQSADAYLKNNPAAVQDPLNRLTADPVYQKVVQLKGKVQPEAAPAFEDQFRQNFEKDLKTSMAVKRVKDGSLSEADALSRSTAETEAAYKQKAADFFKDMHDPIQRKRLNALVEGIYDKFNPEIITKEQLKDILMEIPKKDRALAVALLQESAGSSSDTLLSARLKVLRSDIESQLGTACPDGVYTLAPNSSGNLLGYLYRKSNSIHMDIHNIDQLADTVAKGHIPHSIVLFDDIASTAIPEATRDLLKKIPKVFVVDLGAFEKSVNITDLSKGSDAVSTKLASLLDQAKVIATANPGLLPTGVARQTLSGAVDDVARELGANVQVIRPTGQLVSPSGHPMPKPQPGDIAGVSSTDGATSSKPQTIVQTVNELHRELNVPKTSKEEIASFLSGYAGQERELAAQMIAEGAVHNSFPTMVSKAVDLHSKLTGMLETKGLSINDLVMVSDKDPGGSTHLVTYLFGNANGLTGANFVSSRQLDKLIQNGGARNKVLAYFDDTIYSGDQTAGMLDSNIASLSPFKRVVVASLGAYETGLNKIKATHLGKLGKVDVASPSTHHPFYSDQHPFYSNLEAPQRLLVKKIGGSNGWGSVQGSLIWPYMYPDNNINFFGSEFSGTVLHLPGP